jgi:hypothetical protein
MANQIDNVLLDDDTTGLPRTIDVGADALFLSTDLTLQAGGVLTADNVKRGTADPNVALVPGNEGDIYERTLAATGQLWVNTDGTTTGWAQLLTTGSTSTWAQVLAAGNLSGGTHPTLTSGDELRGQVGASLAGAVLLRGGTASSGTAAGGGVTLIGGDAVTAGAGGSVTFTPGVGAGAGARGAVVVDGIKHYPASAADPTSPAPAGGDVYYNTTLNMWMSYDSTRTKWLSIQDAYLQFGRNGSLLAGQFLRGVDGMVTSATRGYDAIFNGTVVAVSIRRSTMSGATYAVVSSGVDIATVTYIAPNLGVRTTTYNANFVAGAVLAARLATDAIPTDDNAQMWVRIKWRV